MPPSTDSAPAISALSWRSVLLIAAMIAVGFGLTLLVFYPGIWTYDARFVYQDIAKGFRGDWQSPVMIVLWSLIDPVAPGAGSMFLLTVTLYWLAFGLLALTVVRCSVWLAASLLLLALSPPAFVFIGILWRDVLFACLWLLAAVLAFAVADREAKLRVLIQAMAFGLLALGILLRPNALIAAPILLAAIVWPTRFFWKRAAIIFAPAGIGLFVLVQVVYYGVLGAVRQHPLHPIIVFDLGGISHFTQQNQFPVTWNTTENTLVTAGCYQPTEWNIYWTSDPCQFVMKRLESDKIFGTPALADAWQHAVTYHPVAYLQHRVSFMWNFLAGGENLTMWSQNIDDPPNMPFADRPAFVALKTIHDLLKPTPLFRAGSWLLACIAVCAFAWRRRNTPAGVFAIGVCGSACVYVLTFFAVGVASDFRYAYWAVIASIAGAVAVAHGPPESTQRCPAVMPP
jgi:hypothetical protein